MFKAMIYKLSKSTNEAQVMREMCSNLHISVSICN